MLMELLARSKMRQLWGRFGTSTEWTLTRDAAAMDRC